MVHCRAKKCWLDGYGHGPSHCRKFYRILPHLRSTTAVRAVEEKEDQLVGHMAGNKNIPVGSNLRFCGF